eukprot:PLAT152.12.p1 GENE.PLAT152.12~~PLAT152.12.p1  ORF type:complete len:1162 (-),score=697.22 PLAT152.12:11-3496(-)
MSSTPDGSYKTVTVASKKMSGESSEKLAPRSTELASLDSGAAPVAKYEVDAAALEEKTPDDRPSTAASSRSGGGKRGKRSKRDRLKADRWARASMRSMPPAERARFEYESLMDVELSRFALSFIEGLPRQLKVLERTFERALALRLRRFLRVTTVLFILTQLFFIQYDLSTISNQQQLLLVLSLRFALLVPIGCGILMLTVLRKQYFRHSRQLWIAGIPFGLGLVAYTALGDNPGYGTVLVFVVYVYNFVPLPFSSASLTTAFILIAFNFVAYFFRTSDGSAGERTFTTTQYVANVGIVVLFYLFQTIPSYNREKLSRLDLLQQEQLTKQQKLLQLEEARSEELLRSMLPEEILNRLRAGESVSDEFKSVTVLFCEIGDFARLTKDMEAEAVVFVLNEIYSAFDALIDEHKVHKVETVGEVYMVVAGCPTRMRNHAVLAANMALEMQAEMPAVRARLVEVLGDIGRHFRIRIGLNSGPIVAGVIGSVSQRYKLFGDTVNTASRMESTCDPGKIQCSNTCHALLKGTSFEMELRGEIRVKGKGMMKTHYLLSSLDGTRKEPIYIETPGGKAGAGRRVYRGKRGSGGRLAKTSRLAASSSSSSTTGGSGKGGGGSGKGGSSSSGDDSKDGSDSAASGIVLESASEESKEDRPDSARSTRSTSSRRSAKDGSSSFSFRNNKKRLRGRESESVVDFARRRRDSIRGREDIDLMALPGYLEKPLVLATLHNGSMEAEDAVFEAQFQAHFHDRWMRFLQLSCGAAILVSPLFLITDAALDGGRRLLFSVIRYGVVVPLLIVLLLLTWYQRAFGTRAAAFSVVTLAAVGGALVTTSAYSDNPGWGLLALFISYLYNFSILSFATRAAVGGLLVCAYCIAVPLYQPAFSSLALHATYLVVFWVGQGFPVYYRDVYMRVAHFRQRRLLEQRNVLEEEEKVRTELLEKLLPPVVVERLKNRELVADTFESVTIIFTDMVGFTSYSSRIKPRQLVKFLNFMYSQFDEIAARYGIYKVETIGDAYYAVAGCPEPMEDHAQRMAKAALEMVDTLPLLAKAAGAGINIRVGLHTGPVVAAVVGLKDPRYHLFGAAVDRAHKMESSGTPGRIQVTSETYAELKADFTFAEASPAADGHGGTFFLTGIRRRRDVARSPEATSGGGDGGSGSGGSDKV